MSTMRTRSELLEPALYHGAEMTMALLPKQKRQICWRCFRCPALPGDRWHLIRRTIPNHATHMSCEAPMRGWQLRRYWQAIRSAYLSYRWFLKES